MIPRVRMARKRLAIARERAKSAIQRYYALPSGARDRLYRQKERRMNELWNAVKQGDRTA